MNTKSVRNLMTVVGMMAAFPLAASAQDGMKANINFPFVAQGVKLEPGVYVVKSGKIAGGNGVYFVTNANTRKTILVGGFFANEASAKSAMAPRLVFQCNEGEYCVLKQVWDGSRRYSERITSASSGSNEHLKEVALVRDRR